jgi:methylthioribose-1-phosphate isomerase
MRIDGLHYRTIWPAPDGAGIEIIDQTALPHRFTTTHLRHWTEVANAIRDMKVRGAPLIGVAGAYGLALAMMADASDEDLANAHANLAATRPTAVNLVWALDRMRLALEPLPQTARAAAAWTLASELANEDAAICSQLGDYGLPLLQKIFATKKSGERLNILTHCNAGWLATVDWGTATAAIYKAHDAGLPVHVFVDETRPRNQGAALTAWELGHHGVPHTIIVDNAGGHLMQHGEVDVVIVGTDRTTARGDVCNKIGTYLKALAAHDNQIPFFVAAPSSSIDFSLDDGVKSIPIEQRDGSEVTHLSGRTHDGRVESVQVTPDGSPVSNYAFDVTPARLVTGLITERGIVAATRDALASAFPDRVLTKAA